MRSELGLLLALALGGCAGSIDDPAAFSGDCKTYVDHYVAQTCAVSGCHTAQAPQAGLDLQTLPLDPRLVGKPGTGVGCENNAYVNLDKPEDSLIYLKLASDTPPCGLRMPQGGAKLSTVQLECVLDWIVAKRGAAP